MILATRLRQRHDILDQATPYSLRFQGDICLWKLCPNIHICNVAGFGEHHTAAVDRMFCCSHNSRPKQRNLAYIPGIWGSLIHPGGLQHPLLVDTLNRWSFQGWKVLAYTVQQHVTRTAAVGRVPNTQKYHASHSRKRKRRTSYMFQDCYGV